MKLSKSPKGSSSAIASGRFKLRLIGHNHTINDICFNADATLMLSGGYDSPIVQWDTATGRMTRLLPAGSIVCDMPDSDAVFINDNRGLAIRNISSGKLLRRFRDRSEAVSVSEDGSLAAFFQDGDNCNPRIVVIGVPSGGILLDFQLPEVVATIDIAICKEGGFVTACYYRSSDENSNPYELMTIDLDGREISCVRTENEVKRLFIRPSTQTVCVTDGQCVWDAASMGVIATAPENLKFSTFHYQTIGYSARNDELLIGTTKGQAAAWSLATGSVVMGFNAHNGWVRSLVPSKDLDVVDTCGDDHLIRHWERSSGTLLKEFGRPLMPLCSVAFQSEDIVACAARGGAYWRVDINTGEIRETGKVASQWGADSRVGDNYINHMKAIRGLAAESLDRQFEIRVSLDGSRAVERFDQEIEITNLDTGQLIGRVRLNDQIWCASTAISNGGELYSMQTDKSLDLIALDTCEVIASHAIKQDFGKMAFNQAGTLLIYVDGWTGDCSVLDLATNIFSKRSRFRLEAGAVAIAPDGIIAAAGDAYEPWLRLYNIESGKRSAGFVGHEAGLRGASFSLDGKRLASVGNDGLMKIWDVPSQRLLVTFAPLPDGDWITYTPDGYYIGSERAEDYFVWTDGRKVVESSVYSAERRSPQRIAAALIVN